MSSSASATRRSVCGMPAVRSARAASPAANDAPHMQVRVSTAWAPAPAAAASVSAAPRRSSGAVLSPEESKQDDRSRPLSGLNGSMSHSSPSRHLRSRSGDALAALSRGFSPPDDSRPTSPSKAPLVSSGSASNGYNEHTRALYHSAAVQSPLPPHLSHLAYAHHAFPVYLLSLAARLYKAKCRDLAIAHSKEKERRFVWLLCRQSMGGGTAEASSGGGAHSPGGGADSPDPSADSSSGELLSFRIPDASLGPHAMKELCTFLSGSSESSPGRRFGHLQLSGNSLGEEGVEQLASMLGSNSTITSLDIRGTGVGQHGFVSILTQLEEHQSLTSLDASSLKSEGRMFLGSLGARALGRVLRSNTVLRKLHLSNSGLVSEGVSSVAKGLCLNRTLTSLDLSANELGSKNIARLGEALRHVLSLESLSLADNNMGTPGAVFLAEQIRTLENLRLLDLRRNQIGLKGFVVLTDLLGDLISLQELLLDGNALLDTSLTGGGGDQSRGGSALGHRRATTGTLLSASAAASATNATSELVDGVLKRLYLSEKRVSPRMASANTSLRILSLSHSQMTDRVLEDLVKVLANHKGLHSLNLAGNHLTDVSGFAMAAFVKQNAHVRSINLGDNQIGDEGGAALCLALGQSPTSQVSFLSLRVNNVGKSSATALLYSLARKRTLHVDLTGNKIPWVLFCKVGELSARNQRLFRQSQEERYQHEFEELQSRHEYRLEVEEQCLQSVEEVAALQKTLEELEATIPPLKAREHAETRVLQEELEACTHALYEAHALEKSMEATLNARVKENESRLSNLRKAIEKEQRFIASAEKLIPATVEERAAAEALTERSQVDVRRDLRLYIGDRTVEFDSLEAVVRELKRFVQELDSKVVKPPRSARRRPSASSPSKRSGSRPSSGKRGAYSPLPSARRSSRSPSGSPSASRSPSRSRTVTPLPSGRKPSSRPASGASSAANSRPASAQRTGPATSSSARPKSGAPDKRPMNPGRATSTGMPAPRTLAPPGASPSPSAPSPLSSSSSSLSPGPSSAGKSSKGRSSAGKARKSAPPPTGAPASSPAPAPIPVSVGGGARGGKPIKLPAMSVTVTPPPVSALAQVDLSLQTGAQAHNTLAALAEESAADGHKGKITPR